MKRKLVIICMIMLLGNGLNAQKKGLLGKISDKLEEVSAAAAAGPGATPNEKELQKDIDATDLDNITVPKDSRNIGGVYYSHIPVRIGHMTGGKYNWAKKFLVTYEEGDNHFMEFKTRYSLNPKNEISPLVFGPRPGTPDYFPITTSKKLGNLLIDGMTDKKYGGAANHYYGVPSHFISFAKPEGQYITQSLIMFNFPYIFDLEPGILVAIDMDLLIKANTPEKYKFLLDKGAYILFYKKEKEQEALAISKEKLYDRLKTWYTKYDALYRAAEGNNVELAKPIAKFKDEPSNADLVKAVKERMAQMPYFTEDLVYVYPVTTWENRFENVGIMGRTLTHRVLQVQAILKQGDQYKMTQFLIRQDNAYSAGSSAESFSSKPVQAIGDIDKKVISAPNALKYKK